MSMTQFDAPRPFNTGEQLVGDSIPEVFARTEIKAERWTPAKFPGVAPTQPFPALAGEDSILGPDNLSHPRFAHRFVRPD